MKTNYRLLIIALVLFLSSFATTYVTNASLSTNATTVLISENHYNWDADYDGWGDTVQLDIRVDYADLNNDMLNVYLEIYDETAGSVLLESYLVSSKPYIGSSYFYESQINYQSPITGTLSFHISATVNGTFIDEYSFTETVDEYSERSMEFYNVDFYSVDHDIDSLQDTLVVEFEVDTTNITNYYSMQATLGVYLYDSISLEYQLVRNLDKFLYFDNDTQTRIGTEFEYHIRDAGDYYFELNVTHVDITISSPYYWFGANVDTLNPLQFSANFVLNDNDGLPGIDSYDVFVDFYFIDFDRPIDYVNLYMYGWNTATYNSLNSRYRSVFGNELGYTQVVFSGAFPEAGDYIFQLEFYDDFGLNAEILLDVNFNVSAYVGPFMSLALRPETYEYEPDYLAMGVEVQYLNIDGNYPVVMDVFLREGTEWVLLETISDQDMWAYGGQGSWDLTYYYYPTEDGDYRFEVSILADGYYVFASFEWYNVIATSVNIDTWWYWNDTGVTFENWVSYDFPTLSNVEIVFVIYLKDEGAGVFNYYEEHHETREFIGSNSEYVYFDYFATVDGFYQFEVFLYVDGNLRNDETYTSEEIYITAAIPELSPNVWGNDWDEDNDGYRDHITMYVSVDYYNYPGSNIDIYVDVFVDGNLVNDFDFHEYIEGTQYREFNFDYTAEQDGNYQFKVRFEVNGEQIVEQVYYWDDVRAYDPNRDTNDTDDTETTPDLPIPAGSMYLFVFALFAAATTIRRRKN